MTFKKPLPPEPRPHVPLAGPPTPRGSFHLCEKLGPQQAAATRWLPARPVTGHPCHGRASASIRSPKFHQMRQTRGTGTDRGPKVPGQPFKGTLARWRNRQTRNRRQAADDRGPRRAQPPSARTRGDESVVQDHPPGRFSLLFITEIQFD